MIANIENIIDYINGSNDFIVTSHISPDGDNIVQLFLCTTL